MPGRSPTAVGGEEKDICSFGASSRRSTQKTQQLFCSYFRSMENCKKVIFENGDFTNIECLMLFVSKVISPATTTLRNFLQLYGPFQFLGYAIVLGAMVVKLPQILVSFTSPILTPSHSSPLRFGTDFVSRLENYFGEIHRWN